MDSPEAAARAARPSMECCECFLGLCCDREVATRRKVLLRAKGLLKDRIHAKSCGPILLRMAWHDAGTFDKNDGRPWPEPGGAIGSLRSDEEIHAAPNAGLKKGINVYLMPIKNQCPEISWADLLQLGGATAVEEMGGPKIPMRYGRLDGFPKEPAGCPFGLPDAHPPFGGGKEGLKDPQDPAEHLRYVFYKYGMDDKDIVALSGAHTVGRAFKDRSGAVEEGYLGGTIYTKRGSPNLASSETAGGRSWTRSWLTFDNSYFTSSDETDPETLSLPTDRVLREDPGFRPHFEAFRDDQAAFFAAYAASHKKLSELGAKFGPPRGITGV